MKKGPAKNDGANNQTSWETGLWGRTSAADHRCEADSYISEVGTVMQRKKAPPRWRGLGRPQRPYPTSTPQPRLSFMPRFYVHIKHGADLIRDEEGIDLPTPEHARAEALQAARELCVDAINSGAATWGADAFVIADERGKQLTLVPVTEVLPKQ